MRASELLGLAVLDAAGHRIGQVIDLRCVKEAAPDGAWGVLRVDAVVVGRRRIASRLGYERHQHSPAVLPGLVRRVHGDVVVVAWSSVASWSAERVQLRCG